MKNMLAFDFGITDGLYWIWEGVWQAVYSLWHAIASIVDVMERVFMMLAGFNPLGTSTTPAVSESTDAAKEIPGNFKDLPAWLINQPVIKILFQNLIVFAIIMLMFFTIIVIIREQYKNKDGGNPYQIVFRTFKGMIMLLFVTGAVLVGLYASGVILTGLNKITRLKADDSISGQIFYAMAVNANRYNFYTQNPNDIPEDADMLDKVRAEKSRQISQKGSTTYPFYFTRTSEVVVGSRETFAPYLENEKDIVLREVTYQFFDERSSGLSDESGYKYNKVVGSERIVPSSEVSRIIPWPGVGAPPNNIYSKNRFKTTQQAIAGQTANSESDAILLWRNLLSDILNYGQQIENLKAESSRGKPFTLAQFSILNAGDQTVMIKSRSASTNNASNVASFVVLIPELIEASKLDNVNSPEFLQRLRTDFKIKEGYDANHVGNPVAIKDLPTAAAVDQQMKKKYMEDTNFNMFLYRKSGATDPPAPVGAVSYSNTQAVIVFYDITEMNFFIGFLGILMVAGVYLSFVFGLLQRAMEIVILYVLSPLTIAMYPFDDGASFNNNFVKPFYKKVISVYAVILSLNIFFLIYPVFMKITFFESSYIGNSIMSLFMMLALIGMLPKMRSMITNLLGADGIEERGIGQVVSDARDATWGSKAIKSAADGAKMIGRDAKNAANNTIGRGWRAARRYGDFKEANMGKAYDAEKSKVTGLGWSKEKIATHMQAFKERQMQGGAMKRFAGKVANKTGLAAAGRGIASMSQAALKTNLGQAMVDATKDWNVVKFVKDNNYAARRKRSNEIREAAKAAETEKAKTFGERAKVTNQLGRAFDMVSDVEKMMQLHGINPASIKTTADLELEIGKLKAAGTPEADKAAKYLNNRKEEYFKSQTTVAEKAHDMGLSKEQVTTMGNAYSNLAGSGNRARREEIKNMNISEPEKARLRQEHDMKANQEWTRIVESVNADKLVAFSDAQAYQETISGVVSAAGAEKTMEEFGSAMNKFPPELRAAIALDPVLMNIAQSKDPDKFQQIAEKLKMVAEGDYANSGLSNELIEFAKAEFAKPDGDKMAYNFEKLATTYEIMGSTSGPMSGTDAGSARNVAAHVYEVAMIKQQEVILVEQRNDLKSDISKASGLYEEYRTELAALRPDTIVINGKDIMTESFNGFTGKQILEESNNPKSISNAELNEARKAFFEKIMENPSASDKDFRTALSQLNAQSTDYAKNSEEYARVISILAENEGRYSKQKGLWGKDS